MPIVFTSVVDPVGGGFVDSLTRPGGNTTGFALFEYGLSGKWLEILKQIAPGVTRAAVLRDAATTRTAAGQSDAIQAVAPSLGVELSPAVVRDAHEIERAVTTFAAGSNDGLVVIGSPLTAIHSDLIVALAAQHRLPGGLSLSQLRHPRRSDLLRA